MEESSTFSHSVKERDRGTGETGTAGEEEGLVNLLDLPALPLEGEERMAEERGEEEEVEEEEEEREGSAVLLLFGMD